MRLSARIAKLEGAVLGNRCRECGGEVRWLVSIEERERVTQAVDEGRAPCRRCAEQIVHRALAMPREQIEMVVGPGFGGPGSEHQR